MIDFSYANNIASLILMLVLFVICDVILFYLIRRWFVVIYVSVCEVMILLSWLFLLYVVMYISIAALSVGTLLSLIVNMGDIRMFIANSMKGKATFELFRKKQKVKPEKIFDREDVYKKVETAVLTLSRQKIGALITFERNDDLTEIMKNGTIINAPVTPELIQTIFYPGTRLHDGAIVIRNDTIVAASVYFTPTNRPLTGKYGSRHRAAYGISETTDAVTIIVSEETGRISIGFQGELTPVTPDTLLRIFEEDMATETPEKEEGEEGQASK